MTLNTSGQALSLIPFKAIPIAQKSIAAGSIGASYSIVGSIFAYQMVTVLIISTLDADVQFSWDGVTDAFPILARSAIVLDCKSNLASLPASYGPYVKRIGTPGTGSLYIGGFTV